MKAMMLSRRLALVALLATVGGSAVAAPPPRRYRLRGGPDVASEIILHPDGRFQYFLAAGALDEHAEGKWTRDGQSLHLTTVPRPRPAVFSAGATERSTEDPFTLRVTWPDGRGVALVDFILDFDSGEPAEGYTQEDGWMLDPADRRRPRSVRFAVPMYGLTSPTFPIDAAKGNRFTFILTPNDLGVFDFENIPVTMSKDRLIVHRGGGELIYVAQQ